MTSFYQMFLILNENQFTPAILANMNRTLKAQGYDVRGPEDVKQILDKGSVYKNGKFTHEDWQNAYNKAVATKEKTKNTLNSKKQLMPHVDFSQLQRLGFTTNPQQAGYIHPNGKLVDLSGGRTGRNLDHRIIGGYAAIQEIGAHQGYIRYIPEGNGFEIRKLPTTQQFIQIRNLIAANGGEAVLDLYQGIGQWDNRFNSYTPTNKSNKVFEKGTKPELIVNNIKKFYS